MSFLMPKMPSIPASPGPPPAFGQIQGQKPQRKPMTPTFLGTGTTPTGAPSQVSGGATQKTLLGQ